MRRFVRGVTVCVAMLGVVLLSAVFVGAAWSDTLLIEGVAVRGVDELPTIAPRLSALEVAEESWNGRRLQEVFGPSECIELPSAGPRASDGGRWLRLEDGALLRPGSAGTGFYLTAPEPGVGANRSCDASEAVAVAAAYIRDHGGLPDDAELWSVRDVLAVPLDLDGTGGVHEAPRVLARYVEYRHQVSGMLFDGPGGGDSIKVRVGAGGHVDAYGRTWRTAIERSSTAASRSSVSARQAFAAALRDGSTLGKSGFSDSVEVLDARLVWLSPSREVSRRTLEPAWRFSVSCDGDDRLVFVNALSGAVVGGDE